MADGTGIGYVDATWNIITGCSLASPGCTHCYAMKLAGTRLKHHPSRAGLTVDTKAGPVWNGTVRFNEQWLCQPLQWKRPRRIFVCAHGDLFHESVPDLWIDMIFAVMAQCPQHTFLVLTKRAGRMREYLNDSMRLAAIYAQWHGTSGTPREVQAWPLPNVWAGVSAEDQARADERIVELLRAKAAVRWVSIEPMLGPIDLNQIKRYEDGWTFYDDALNGFKANQCGGTYGNKLDWVVLGGENGPRPLHPSWVRRVRNHCGMYKTAFNFKQWGNWRPICQSDSDWYQHLYRSNRVAERGQEQHVFDDIYGRTCTVAQGVLSHDGRFREGREMYDPGAWQQGSGAVQMFNVGKKEAGRLLDGVLHDGYPEGKP